MQNIRNWASLLLLAACLPLTGKAQLQRHALIIGIDRYDPPAAVPSPGRQWTNLDGCANDATCIRDYCLSAWNFDEPRITTLLNETATRDNIIQALENLLQQVKKGDVVLIYYAGHGSQVKNSLSHERDKKDETIVPADHWKNGVRDIRDKELAVFFNRLIDKGAILTVIFDSCHSGSIGRGKTSQADAEEKTRYMEEAAYDAKDPSIQHRPEERGALILSAAQDFELAKEQKDENNITHGAFTYALLKALRQLPAGAPSADIFNSLSAILKFYGKTQEPVLAANTERKRGPLIGSRGMAPGKLKLASGKKMGAGLEMMGGFAFGMAEGLRLAKGTDTLEIVEMKGVNRCIARVLTGDIDLIPPGTLFEPVNWVNSSQPELRLFIPEAVNTEALRQYISIYQQLKHNQKIKWVSGNSTETPARLVYFESSKWFFRDKNNSPRELQGGLTDLLRLEVKTPYTVYFPPTPELINQLEKYIAAYTNARITADATRAHYILTGMVSSEGKAVYGFKKNTAVATSLHSGLPAGTDFVPAENAEHAARKLSEGVYKIGRIRDWILLTPPANDNRFPFVLDFTYYRTGKPVTSKKVKTGDTLTIHFKEDTLHGGWNNRLRKRYVYVFSIDSRGSMNLLFPSPESGNTENRMPINTSTESRLGKIPLADIEITPPAGTDYYFMLSSEQAINDISVFSQDAVLSRGSVKLNGEGNNPLERLLYTGSKTRGQLITPVNWGIYKTELVSTR